MLLAAMVRPEDTIRGPRAYHHEGNESTEEIPYDAPAAPEPSHQPSYQPPAPPPLIMNEKPSNPPPELVPAQTNRPPVVARLLTQEETLELTRRAVENGLRETKRSLAGSEDVSEAVKPKLTIDLGHSNIVRIPEPVVDIIKDEVERYTSLDTTRVYSVDRDRQRS